MNLVLEMLKETHSFILTATQLFSGTYSDFLALEAPTRVAVVWSIKRWTYGRRVVPAPAEDGFTC